MTGSFLRDQAAAIDQYLAQKKRKRLDPVVAPDPQLRPLAPVFTKLLGEKPSDEKLELLAWQLHEAVDVIASAPLQDLTASQLLDQGFVKEHQPREESDKIALVTEREEKDGFYHRGLQKAMHDVSPTGTHSLEIFKQGVGSFEVYLEAVNHKHGIPYIGLTEPSRRGLLELPNFLFDMLHTAVAEHDRVLWKPENANDKDRAKHLVEAIHNPWPAKVISTVFTDPELRQAYAQHLDKTIVARMKAIQADPKGSPEERKELDILYGVYSQGGLSKAARPAWVTEFGGLSGLIRQWDKVPSQKREEIRRWAGTELADLMKVPTLYLVPVMGDPQRLAEYAAKHQKTGNRLGGKDDNLAVSLLLMTISAIDEAGDTESGPTVALVEKAKGGMARFEPHFMSTLIEEETKARAELAKKTPGTPSPQEKFLDEQLTALDTEKNPRGIGLLARLRVLNSTADQLKDIQYVRRHLAELLPAEHDTESKASATQLVQIGDPLYTAQVARDQAPEYVNYRVWEKHGFQLQRQTVIKELAETGTLSEKGQAAFDLLLQVQMEREWKPNRLLKLRQEQPGLDLKALEERLNNEQKEALPGEKVKLMEALRLEAAVPILAEAKKKAIEDYVFTHGAGVKDRAKLQAEAEEEIGSDLKELREAISFDVEHYHAKSNDAEAQEDWKAVQATYVKYGPLMERLRKVLEIPVDEHVRNQNEDKLVLLGLTGEALAEERRKLNNPLARAAQRADALISGALSHLKNLEQAKGDSFEKAAEAAWEEWKQKQDKATTELKQVIEKSQEEFLALQKEAGDKLLAENLETNYRQWELQYLTYDVDVIKTQIEKLNGTFKSREYQNRKKFPTEQKELMESQYKHLKAHLEQSQRQLDEKHRLFQGYMAGLAKSHQELDAKTKKASETMLAAFTDRANKQFIDGTVESLDTFLGTKIPRWEPKPGEQVPSESVLRTQDLQRSQLRNYFELRERMEKLAAAAAHEKDWRHSPLLTEETSPYTQATKEDNGLGFRLSEDQRDQLLQKAWTNRREKMAEQTRLAGEMRKWGVRFSQGQPNFDHVDLFTLDRDKFQKTLEAYHQNKSDEFAAPVTRAVQLADKTGYWSTYVANIVEAWKQLGQPAVFPVPGNATSSVRVIRDPAAKEGFTLKFEDSNLLARQATKLVYEINGRIKKGEHLDREIRGAHNTAAGIVSLVAYKGEITGMLQAEAQENKAAMKKLINELKAYGFTPVDSNGEKKVRNRREKDGTPIQEQIFYAEKDDVGKAVSQPTMLVPAMQLQRQLAFQLDQELALKSEFSLVNTSRDLEAWERSAYTMAEVTLITAPFSFLQAARAKALFNAKVAELVTTKGIHVSEAISLANKGEGLMTMAQATEAVAAQQGFIAHGVHGMQTAVNLHAIEVGSTLGVLDKMGLRSEEEKLSYNGQSQHEQLLLSLGVFAGAAPLRSVLTFNSQAAGAMREAALLKNPSLNPTYAKILAKTESALKFRPKFLDSQIMMRFGSGALSLGGSSMIVHTGHDLMHTPMGVKSAVMDKDILAELLTENPELAKNQKSIGDLLTTDLWDSAKDNLAGSVTTGFMGLGLDQWLAQKVASKAGRMIIVHSLFGGVDTYSAITGQNANEVLIAQQEKEANEKKDPKEREIALEEVKKAKENLKSYARLVGESFLRSAPTSLYFSVSAAGGKQAVENEKLLRATREIKRNLTSLARGERGAVGFEKAKQDFMKRGFTEDQWNAALRQNLTQGDLIALVRTAKSKGAEVPPAERWNLIDEPTHNVVDDVAQSLKTNKPRAQQIIQELHDWYLDPGASQPAAQREARRESANRNIDLIARGMKLPREQVRSLIADLIQRRDNAGPRGSLAERQQSAREANRALYELAKQMNLSKERLEQQIVDASQRHEAATRGPAYADIQPASQRTRLDDRDRSKDGVELWANRVMHDGVQSILRELADTRLNGPVAPGTKWKGRDFNPATERNRLYLELLGIKDYPGYLHVPWYDATTMPKVREMATAQFGRDLAERTIPQIGTPGAREIVVARRAKQIAEFANRYRLTPDEIVAFQKANHKPTNLPAKPEPELSPNDEAALHDFFRGLQTSPGPIGLDAQAAAVEQYLAQLEKSRSNPPPGSPTVAQLKKYLRKLERNGAKLPKGYENTPDYLTDLAPSPHETPDGNLDLSNSLATEFFGAELFPPKILELVNTGRLTAEDVREIFGKDIYWKVVERVARDRGIQNIPEFMKYARSMVAEYPKGNLPPGQLEGILKLYTDPKKVLSRAHRPDAEPVVVDGAQRKGLMAMKVGDLAIAVHEDPKTTEVLAAAMELPPDVMGHALRDLFAKHGTPPIDSTGGVHSPMMNKTLGDVSPELTGLALRHLSEKVAKTARLEEKEAGGDQLLNHILHPNELGYADAAPAHLLVDGTVSRRSRYRLIPALAARIGAPAETFEAFVNLYRFDGINRQVTVGELLNDYKLLHPDPTKRSDATPEGIAHLVFAPHPKIDWEALPPQTRDAAIRAMTVVHVNNLHDRIEARLAEAERAGVKPNEIAWSQIIMPAELDQLGRAAEASGFTAEKLHLSSKAEAVAEFQKTLMAYYAGVHPVRLANSANPAQTIWRMSDFKDPNNGFVRQGRFHNPKAQGREIPKRLAQVGPELLALYQQMKELGQ